MSIRLGFTGGKLAYPKLRSFSILRSCSSFQTPLVDTISLLRVGNGIIYFTGAAEFR